MTDAKIERLLVNRNSGSPLRPPLHHSPMRSMFVKAIAETGMSNYELSCKSGLSKSTVQAMMSGRREGRIENWDILLQTCGIELGYRLKEKE